MKKTLLTAILCFIAAFSYAQNVRVISATHYYEDNPKKEMTFYDASGSEVAREYYHIDGRVMGVKGSIPDGDIFEYYPDKTLKSKAEYKSNLLVEEVEYYEDGVKKSETKNKWDGRLLKESDYTIYYPNAAKRQQIKMDTNGDGVSKLYYESGELFEEAVLKKSFRDGAVIRYHKNGKKMLTGFMKDDMLSGAAVLYDLNGNIERKAEYKDDEIINK